MTPRTTPPRILLHPATEHASGRYRIKQPAQALQDAGLATVRVDFRYHDNETLIAMAPDTVVFQHPYSDEQIETIKRYSKVLPGTLLVFEIDDMLWDIPETNPSADLLTKNMNIKARLARGMKLCHKVTTTNAVLADAISADLGIDRSKIEVVPNYISQDFINKALAGRKNEAHAKPRVGWAGGISHKADLALLRDAIVATHEQVTWVFMGIRPDDLPEDVKYEFHDPVHFEDYPTALGALDLDLALAPLEDTRFNKCKSDLRVLEYAAAGFGVLCSAVSTFAWFYSWATLNVNWVPMLKAILFDKATRTAEEERYIQLWLKNSWLLQEPGGMKRVAESGQRLHDHIRSARLLENPDNLAKIAAAWTPKGQKPFVQHHHYRTLDFANYEHGIVTPGKNLIYRRRGCTETDEQLTLAQEILLCTNEASVSAWSNDGDYPTTNQFTPLSQADGEILIDAALSANEDSTIPVPYPGGPFILMSAYALDRVGYPDAKRYPDPEMAIAEWGARATAHGLKHLMATGLFVPAPEAVKRDPRALQHLMQAISLWWPNSPEQAKTLATNPELAAAKQRIDLHRYRIARDPTGDTGERLLLINGQQDDIERLQAEGHSVLPAGVVGHLLCLDPRAVPNVPPVDMRRDREKLLEVLGRLMVTRIFLNGLQEGSMEVLGMLRVISAEIPVVYRAINAEPVCPRLNCTNTEGPCGNLWDAPHTEQGTDLSGCQACLNRDGSPFGFVNPWVYRSQWNEFLRAIAPPEPVKVESSDV